MFSSVISEVGDLRFFFFLFHLGHCCLVGCTAITLALLYLMDFLLRYGHEYEYISFLFSCSISVVGSCCRLQNTQTTLDLRIILSSLSKITHTTILMSDTKLIKQPFY
jgi:hypothetical protein